MGHEPCLSFIAVANRTISESDLLMGKRTSAIISSVCSSAVPLCERRISVMLGSPEVSAAVLALHAFLQHEDMTCSLCLLHMSFTPNQPQSVAFCR